MSLPDGARCIARVGGGDINEAYHVELADGREAFVKTRAGAGSGEYEAEAAGLRWLAEPGSVRTPAVFEVGTSYLALEWVRRGTLSEAGAEELGRGLARTHLAGAGSFGSFARAAAAGFGSLRLSNEPAPDWPTFFATSAHLMPFVILRKAMRSVTSWRFIGLASAASAASGSRFMDSSFNVG